MVESTERFKCATKQVRTAEMLSSVSSVKKQFQANMNLVIRIIKCGSESRIIAWENKI